MMRTLLAIAFTLFSTTAFAHSGHADAAGLGPGLLHPLGGSDHVLAMVAVGILAFALGGRATLLVPLSFLVMLLAGFAVGAAGLPLPGVEAAIALSSVAIGAAVVAGRGLPLPAAATLVGLFAVFHGHAHALEMPTASSAPAYVTGFLAATLALHLLGLFGTSVLARLDPRLVRAGGGIVAAMGAAALAGWL